MERLCLDSTGLNYIDVRECSGTENTFKECGITQRDFDTCKNCDGHEAHPGIVCQSGKHFARNSLSKCYYELQPTALMEP